MVNTPIMDAQALPLVLTKITPPAPRQRTVDRARLLDSVCIPNGPGLTVVCAAAGYGKTTLLAGLAHRFAGAGIPTAWVALDAGDDTPGTFAAYLTASLIQALGPLPELTRLAQLLRSSAEADLNRVMAILINTVAADERECALILDDYHLVSSPAVHTAVAYLVEHLPANLRVVIGSRSDPPLPLARLRARGCLMELRASDLRFTSAEAAEFLNEIMQLGLPEAGVAALEERTEGWVTGLQLAALSLAGRLEPGRNAVSFGGSHRYLADYLMEEVVTRQSPEVQAFLQAACILERMCAPLCAAVAGSGSDSSAILAFLERANLFVVALDDQGTWFRFHHLFRDFLLSRLKKNTPERIPLLHRAACEWLAASGSLREAASHAFQTGDWEYAAAFVEQHSFTLLLHSDIAAIYDWCSRFPEDVMQAHPFLCIHQCWALALSFKKKDRARVEARLQQADAAGASLTDPGKVQELAETSSIIRTFLAMAPDPAVDGEAYLTSAREMLSGYSEGDPRSFSALLLSGYALMALQDTAGAARALEAARQIALSIHLYFGIVESTYNLARLAYHQGQLTRSAEICLEGKSHLAALLDHPEQEVPAIGCLDVALGCVYLEQNRLHEAETSLVHGLSLLTPGMNPGYMLAGCTAMARLYEIQNRPEEAETWLERLEDAWPDIAFCTTGLRIRMALRADSANPARLEEAAEWCRSFSHEDSGQGSLAGIGPLGAADAFHLARTVWAYARVQLGASQQITSFLRQQRTRAVEGGLCTRVIELSLLLARAEESAGKTRQASLELESALQWGEPEKFIRIYDQGPTLRKMLVRAARRGPGRQPASRVLAALEEGQGLPGGQALAAAAHGPAAAPERLVESLSARELEVLRLAANGATNQDIAERLVITVGTTKSHMNHILGKLNAANRTEAVARARQLGLV